MSLISSNFDANLIIFPNFGQGPFPKIAGKSPGFILYYTDALFCISFFKQLISSLTMHLKPTQIKNMILK